MVQIAKVLLVALPYSTSTCIRAMSTSTTGGASIAPKSGGWSDVAIKAAKDLTISVRANLQEQGALDIQRPITISGELVDTAEKSLREDDGSKIIHFQRHGQGYHNLICDLWRELGQPIDFSSTDPTLNPVVRPEFLDPPLTHTGIQQCKARRVDCSQLLAPEVLIVSPLLRCLQTANISFRDHSHIPWVAHEGCREELGLLVGNKRRPLSDIRVDYPDIDFSEMEHEEDVLWESYGDHRRETLTEKSERIYEFLTEFIAKRPEKEIAIVCHSAYLFTLLNAVMHVEDEGLRSWFLTSEVRSVKMRFSKNDEYKGDGEESAGTKVRR